MGRGGGVALYLYGLNEPVAGQDLPGLLACSATLESEWLSGTRVQNVLVNNLAGSAGVGLVNLILFATTLPPGPRPDVTISGSAQIGAQITGALKCSASVV